MAVADTGELITENSIPNLDDWGPDKYWIARDWLEWHKIMKSKKGKTYADSTFMSWWNKQGFGAYPLDAVWMNTEFRTYLKKENLYDKVAGILDKPLGAINDIVSSGSNAVSNVGQGAENTSKILRIAIPALFVIAGLGVSIWIYKKFVK